MESLYRYRRVAVLLPVCQFLLMGIALAEEAPPRWEHDLLRKAGEPRLTDAREGVEEYQFVYVGTYSLLVRATKMDDLVTLRAVQVVGDRILQGKRVTLSKEEWRKITALVGKAEFWKVSPEAGEEGADGTSWLIEGRREGVYRAVSRWTPSMEQERRGLVPFVLLGRYMAKLSGLGVGVQ